MTTDFHNSNFFIAALRAYAANYRIALAVSVGLLLVDWFTTVFSSRFAEYVGPTILVAIFAYAIHHTILLGTNIGWTGARSGKHFNKFLWRSMIFLAVFVLIVAVVFLLLFLIVGRGTSPEALNGWFLILVFLVGLPLFGASFSLLGTILPATVAGSDASFAVSWKRGKGNFWYTLLRLTIGPFLVQIIILGLIFLIVYLGLPLEILTATGALDPLGMLVNLVFQMANLFVTALAASVLCKTYLRSQGGVPTLAP